MKRITLINHSDTKGGASVVSYRLMKALCNLGVDARMVVVDKQTNNPRVDTVGSPMAVRTAFLAEHADIWLHNGFNRDTVFKISTGRFGLPVEKHPWVLDSDAIILNWVNQGMMSLDSVARLCARDIPVAWTMHDMWNMTGVCHHAGTCTRYMAGQHCGNCPLIDSGKHRKDLSSSVEDRKKRLYDGPGNKIKFVAVSNWLAGCARQSMLMEDSDLTVIPNAFPVEDFTPKPKHSRRELHLPEGRLIVMGAARLDDPIKDLPLAIETLNRTAEHIPDAVAVLFGEIREPSLLQGLKMPYRHLGTVADKARLASIYGHASAVLSTSQYETLPGTLVEGISAGAMAVTTGHGGQADIVTDGAGGFIRDSDAQALSDALTEAIENPADRQAQHASMARKFAAPEVATAYLRLLFGDRFLR
ncbi:MAG: glycosyltransferase [Muribaculaceae bacterium]